MYEKKNILYLNHIQIEQKKQKLYRLHKQ